MIRQYLLTISANRHRDQSLLQNPTVIRCTGHGTVTHVFNLAFPLCCTLQLVVLEWQSRLIAVTAGSALPTPFTSALTTLHCLQLQSSSSNLKWRDHWFLVCALSSLLYWDLYPSFDFRGMLFNSMCTTFDFLTLRQHHVTSDRHSPRWSATRELAD